MLIHIYVERSNGPMPFGLKVILCFARLPRDPKGTYPFFARPGRGSRAPVSLCAVRALRWRMLRLRRRFQWALLPVASLQLATLGSGAGVRDRVLPSRRVRLGARGKAGTRVFARVSFTLSFPTLSLGAA